MSRLLWPLLLAFAALWSCLLSAPAAQACGGAFAYRPPASAETVPKLLSDGSEVAIMRRDDINVVSLSMSYRGPAEDFAVIVPVPVVLHADDVTTLSPGVFERLRKVTGPRLVEQWETDPCGWDAYEDGDAREGGTGVAAAAAPAGAGGAVGASEVVVEAAFDVDEYDIVVLGASDSTALEKWLGDNGYALPKGIEPFLRPYVAGGYKFFVAKVNAAKVELSWGRAKLSPIRFHYRDERFRLPIRLGLANVEGPQDLVVYLLGKSRYELANHDNAFVPTNVELAAGLADHFDVVYERLLARAFEQHPKSVLTEFAWDAESCAGCSGPEFERMLGELGAEGLELKPKDLVITRLHARYGADTEEDFVFREAKPVAGGDESVPTDGALPAAQAHDADANRFRARHYIRYPFTGAITCMSPRFGHYDGEGTRPLSKPLAADTPLEALTTGASTPSRTDRAWRWVAGALRGGSPRRLLIPVALALILLGVSLRRHRRDGLPMLWPAVAAVLLSASPLLLKLSHHSWGMAQASTLPEAIYLAFVIGVSLLVSRVTRRAGGLGVATAIALAPVATGLFTMVYGLHALTEMRLDEDTRPLVVAAVEAEAGGGFVIGAVLSCMLLVLVVWLCAVRPGDVAPSGGAKTPGGLGVVPWVAAVVLGLGGAAAAYAPVFELARNWPWLAVVWTLPAVWWASHVVAGAPLTPLTRHRRALALAALAVLMMLLAIGAFAENLHVAGLDAISAMSVDPSQRARILQATFEDTRTFLRFAPLAVLCAAVLPMFVAWRSGSGALRIDAGSFRTAAPAAGVLLVAALLLVATRAQVQSGMARGATAGAATVASDDATPFARNVDRAWRFERSLSGAGFVVTADSRLLGVSAEGGPPEPFEPALYDAMSASMADDDRDALLLLDRDLTVGRVHSALDPVMRRGHRSFRLQVGLAPDRFVGLGIYGRILESRDPRVAVPLTWVHELEVAEPDPHNERGVSGAVALRFAEGDMLEAVALLGREGDLRYRYSELRVLAPKPPEGGRFEVHPGDDGPFDALLWRAKTKTWIICMRQDDTVADIIDLVLALQDRRPFPPEHTPHYKTWEALHPMARIVLTPDHAPFDYEPGT